MAIARKKSSRVSAAIQLDVGRGTLANPRWMALLDGIRTARSITASARSAGLSYKAAWDAIDAMNNLAGEPLVATSVGGRGGGARLTPRGEELLATYHAVADENARFVAQVNARLGHAKRDLAMLGRLAVRTSARNQWSGKIHRVRRGAVNDEVELELPGGDRIVAIATHESVENLGLRRGREAIALVKASSVMVGVGAPASLRLSARNQLEGTVERIVPGAVNAELVIALRGGVSVAAVITRAALQALGLRKGQRATAIFKASSVILGVT